MSTDSWKLEKDLCRCCHSEGSFQNLGASSFYDGQEEIYSDMLRESLDINLNPVDGLLSDVTYTICEMCIARLRDASNFKQQVLRCEENFKDMIKRDFIKIVHPLVQVKPEIIDDEFKDDYIVVNDNFQMLPSDGESDDFKDEADVEMTIELEDKPKKLKGKGKAKPKEPKTKKPAKKTGRPKKIKEDTTDGADSADKTETDSEEKSKKGKPHVDDYILEVTDTDTDKNHMCKACKVAYRRLSDLRNHVIRTHLKEKFIKCRLCTETFMYHSQRKEHMWNTHLAEKPDKFVCNHCNRQFRRKNTLAEHMMDVHIEKNCTLCDLKFARKKYLFHMNEAHGAPMPTCGVCGLRTLKESALVRHQRNVHLNEKNVKCKHCKKQFYTQSNLKDHMITHNPVRSFKCDVCEKSFARKECYRSHYRIHTGEKPYSCDMCSVAFVQRASLRFHIKSHHSGRFGVHPNFNGTLV